VCSRSGQFGASFGFLGDPPPIVLNEYNAVPGDGELTGGSPLGNGGDWFEFLVLEDNLDLRGYTLEFRQRDSGSDQVRPQTFLTFGDHPELVAVPAGTIITIGEDESTDVGFDAVNDWHLHFQVSGFGVGDFFELPPPGSVFNSTRRDQTVLIRNADGDRVARLTGETDGWDGVNGGVGASEVFNLCVSAQQGTVIDPITDYIDNSANSSFGEPNLCVSTDPVTNQVVTQAQDLTALRDSASLGAGNGDVDCNQQLTISDAGAIVLLAVGQISDTGPCLLNGGGPGHEAAGAAADLDGDGLITVGDAFIAAQCSIGLPNEDCP